MTNEHAANYKLLIGGVLPRPIAFITTVGDQGVVNAAPFSFFNVVSTNPPMISVAVMRKPGGDQKDTARNIIASKEFVINVVDEKNVAKVNETSCDYPPEISEVKEAGLTTSPSHAIGVPRIAEARLHYECRLHQHLELGNGPNSDLIIGEIVHIHVDDSLYQKGRIDTQKLAPIGRLAGLDYVKLGEIFSMPRPAYQAKKE
ncbi:flavin reductase family protein [Ammoniphilus sp. 3BR4]|uniref:flavin reductase family protein n=1 Tax=Ammoniphilus sp. 3BR4 TaxID=3158265 RepID=UPI003467A52C